jgi:hypothetical protein
METQQTIYRSLKVLSVALVLQILIIPSLSIKLQAQTILETRDANLSVTFNPPGEDKPKQSSGGASRGGQCPRDDRQIKPYITALIPTSELGLTIEERPTLFVYVPETPARKAFFSLHDESEITHYQTFIDLSDRSGVIAISLPSDAPALLTGKEYKWSFVLMCDNLLRPDSPLVEGYIKKITPNSVLSQRLEEATSLERAKLYGEAGIWYETIATLAQLRISNPDDTKLITVWEELLNSVGLQAIAAKPLR